MSHATHADRDTSVASNRPTTSNVLGFNLTERTDDSAYFRGLHDWEYHTLAVLDTGVTGVDHITFRTSSPEALDELAEQFEAAGGNVTYVKAGEEPG